MYFRFASSIIDTALADTPVVLINGPRQCGKTTLAQTYSSPQRPYFTLDDDTSLAAARNDPTAFLRGLDGAVIDEIQRAPELLRALKRSIDVDRRPGRFLLTGSANLLTLPTVADSLAGRMEVVTLMPLSAAEIHDRKPDFLKQIFKGKPPARGSTKTPWLPAALAGGYPEMLRRDTPARRSAWAREYVRSIAERDIRDVLPADRLEAFPHLLRALALHAGQLANFSQLGGQAGLDDKTTRRYVGALEQLFLVQRIEPWFRNELKRLVKTPKLHFLDPGLLSTLRGWTADKLAKDRSLVGPLLETCVFAELKKQMGWHTEPLRLLFHRSRDGEEVDFLLERQDGAVVAIEVKAAATVTAADFNALRTLHAVLGRDLKLGIVLFDGEQCVPFGERLWAVPLQHLLVPQAAA